MADNGDFIRIMQRFGISHQTPLQVAKDWYTEYVDPVYAFGPVPAVKLFYPSSEIVFVWLASSLRRLFGGTTLDIRWMGITHAVFDAAALALLLLQFSFSALWEQLLFSGIAILVLLDESYVTFFNSFYSEPAFFICLLLFFALAIRTIRTRRLTLLQAALLALAGLEGVLSKTPTVTIAPLVAAAVVGLAWRSSGQRAVRLLGRAAAVTRLGASVALVRAGPETLRKVNMFNIVFRDILPHSASPDEALRDLGLDPSLKTYQGADIWALGISTPDLEARFYSRIS